MSKVRHVFGRTVFWLSWPALWLLLRGSRRTRLLLVCGEEFLAVRGWLGGGEWGLPGGGLHKNESALDGLLREVREETGLTLAPEQIRPAFEGRYRAHGFRFGYQVFTAEVSAKPALQTRSVEIAAAAWQPLNNPTIELSPDTVDILAWWQSR